VLNLSVGHNLLLHRENENRDPQLYFMDFRSENKPLHTTTFLIHRIQIRAAGWSEGRGMKSSISLRKSSSLSRALCAGVPSCGMCIKMIIRKS